MYPPHADSLRAHKGCRLTSNSQAHNTLDNGEAPGHAVKGVPRVVVTWPTTCSPHPVLCLLFQGHPPALQVAGAYCWRHTFLSFLQDSAFSPSVGSPGPLIQCFSIRTGIWYNQGFPRRPPSSVEPPAPSYYINKKRLTFQSLWESSRSHLAMLSPNPTLHYMWQWGKLPPLATHQDIICALTRRLCEEGQPPSGLDNYVSSLGSLTFSRRPQLPLSLQDPVFKNANHLPEESEADGRGRGTWYQHTKYKELGVTYSCVGWDVRKASFSYGNSFKISKSQWATFFCEFLLFSFSFLFSPQESITRLKNKPSYLI